MSEDKVVHVKAGSLTIDEAAKLINNLQDAQDIELAILGVARELRMANAFRYIELREKSQLPMGEVDPDLQVVMERLLTNFPSL
jgi:hypothetical protein